ncbi:MAG: ribokinase [Clostridia bacterium]|nr:ribokinase [Clostridia bacterium]
MRILNYGSLNLDYVYSVPRFVSSGETLAVSGFQINAGGKGLNQSIALARAGAEVYHAGCVGAGGGMLRDMLQKNNVDLRFLTDVPVPQGCAMIQVTPDGENSILLYGGSNYALTRGQIDGVLSYFTSEDWLLLQNEVNELPYLIAAAKARGMHIILNPSPFDEVTASLDYNQIDWVIMNKPESLRLTVKNKPDAAWEALHERFPSLHAVITLGGDGSLLCRPGEKPYYQPVIKTDAVDTTGAGDTFTGFFFAGLVEGLRPEDCMARAAKAAAICVSRLGAAPAIPTLNEVDG